VESVLQVEVSAGELFDKITILEIKAERISDPDKLANIHRELSSLTATREKALDTSPELDEFTAELRRINEQLWKIEDDIRDCERKRDFGQRFIELARAVYRTNDRRAATKRRINELLGSELVEEKDYADY
jgi:peptidoglycan hydrolase CwlO-like protein